MEEAEVYRSHDMSTTTTPVQPVPCDADDQSAPPTSPGKPEVDMRSAHEFVTSPEAAADASPRGDKVGLTDVPASPIGTVSEQEHEQAFVEQTPPKSMPGSPYQCPVSYDVTPISTSYFGESHVNRLQSFVDSVAAGDESTATTSWCHGRLASEPAVTARGRTTLAPCSDLRKPMPPRLAAADEPLDLSVKPPVRRPDPSSSLGEIPFPVPIVPPLFPLLACRESWIAHWATLAAASLQHSLLFPTLAVTSQTGADTTSGAGWMTSSSPRSSSSSSPGTSKQAVEERRRTALTAMESFVESSFKPRQQQQQHRHHPSSSRHDVATNRKRRRHFGAEVTSSGDEDGGSHDEKRKRAEITSCGVKEESVSPRSASDLSPKRDDVSEKRPVATSQSTAEVVNGEAEYLSCSSRYDANDSATEHPLVSLEKFVGISAPLFRSLAAPPSATTSNGISSPICRTAAGKTPSSVDVAMTSGGDSAQEAAVTSRSMRSDVVGSSGSLGRGFTSAQTQSLLCCNL